MRQGVCDHLSSARPMGQLSPRIHLRRKDCGQRQIYYARFMHQGRQLERSTRCTDRKAAQRAAEIIVARIAGRPLETNTDSIQSLLLNFVSTTHANKMRMDTTARRDTERSMHLGRLLADMGVTKIKHLDSEACERLKAHLLNAGKNPKTVNNALSLLKSCTKWSLRRGILASNPLADFELIPRRYTRSRKFKAVLTDAEAQAFLKAASDTNYYEPILTMHFTGLRRREIVMLNVGDVELHRKRYFLKVEEGKSANPRVVPVHAKLAPVIERLIRGRPKVAPLFVQPVTKGRLNVDHFSQVARQIANKAGLSHVTQPLHIFRHTAVTKLLMAGKPDAKVMAVIGHKDPRTLQVYTHIARREVEDIFDDVY